MTFPFYFITGKSIHQIVQSNITTCIDIVKTTYLAHDHGETVNPRSSFLRFPKAPSRRNISLPAFIDGKHAVVGIKWIASWPENIHRGIPRASAVILLNDYDTGYPYVCMEGSIISAARTAASSILAAEVIDSKAKRLGIIGNGLIARYIYQFFLGVGREFTEVWLYDSNPKEAERFGSNVCQRKHHQRVRIAESAKEVIVASEIVVFATVATEPWISNIDLFQHAPTILNISLRDLTPEIILGAQNIVDDVDHVMTANTSVHLASQLTGNRSFVDGTIADVIEKRVSIDLQRCTIFSPFGMGILDIAIGKWIYDKLRTTRDISCIDDFFYELRR